ncbi:MAG: DNA polymerase III subunit delta [Spirochaetaceae bacterium]|nr:DNA polymerase III subunit delta [Spirochaetaceae bacterium]
MATSSLYLFTGPELGEKKDAIENLRIQSRKRLGQLDEHIFYVAETRIQDVMELLLNGSLFASARFIVLNGAEQIKKKEDIELISKWFTSVEKNSEDSSVLILVSDENSCDKKLESIVPKENKRIFWEMFDNRKEQWVADFFKRNGYSISSEAIELLLDMVENNTDALRSECSRFFLCFEPGHRVSCDDVEKILVSNRQESAFTLFEGMCDSSKNLQARFENALIVLQKLRMSKESSGVQLLAVLAYCFRRLKLWHIITQENPYPSDFDLKIKGFSSKKAQSQYRSGAKLWDIKSVSKILAMIAKTDMDIRSSGTMLEDVKLQVLLYSIIKKNGEPIQDYIC